jgi:hypothetical protein
MSTLVGIGVDAEDAEAVDDVEDIVGKILFARRMRGLVEVPINKAGPVTTDSTFRSRMGTGICGGRLTSIDGIAVVVDRDALAVGTDRVTAKFGTMFAFSREAKAVAETTVEPATTLTLMPKPGIGVGVVVMAAAGELWMTEFALLVRVAGRPRGTLAVVMEGRVELTTEVKSRLRLAI